MRNWWLNGASWRSMMVFEAEGAAGGGSDAGAAEAGAGAAAAAGDGTGKPDAGTVLFPNEGKDGKDGKPAGGEAPADKAEGWKPYADDPAKSKEENDAARAAHEKTNPDHPDNQVPADGKYQFTMPEGVALDEKLAAALSPALKDAGLTQGQAQKLATAFAEQRKAEAEAAASEWANIQTGWVDTAKKDKEIGGTSWDASVKTAQGALAKFGTPELRTFLAESGGGNHPEVIRFMARVGKAVSEDRPDAGDGGSGKAVEAAHVLFPSDKPKG